MAQRRPQPESPIKDQVREYLQLNGWFVINIVQKAKNYTVHKGISDLLALKNRVVLFVEVKTKKGSQKPSQIQFEADVKETGNKYVVVRSIEELEFYLSEEGLL